MKFSTVTDVQLFLLELGKVKEAYAITSNDYNPTNEEMDSFIKHRKSLKPSIKSSAKSSAQKFNWMKNRGKIMRGIKGFHKSADGKKFHRRLGRFLATRVTEGYTASFYDKNEYLLALNSLRQHLLMELQYYKPMLEAFETEAMIMDYALPLIKTIEEGIIKDRALSEEELVFVSDMVSRKHFLDSLSEMSGKSFHRLCELCEGIEKQISEGKADQTTLLNALKKEINE